jgi:Ca2+-dependent lipid-binding protein
LGKAQIDVANIEPFDVSDQTLNLVSEKHGEKGQVQVRLLFRPEIIVKARKATSTFSNAGRAMTQLGGFPVTAGKGVIQGITDVFNKKEERDRDSLPDVPLAQASHPVKESDSLEARPAAFPPLPTDVPPQEPGTLRVTVLNAKDLPSSEAKPYATIRVGDKEFKTKHTGKTANPEWCVLFG